MARQESRSWAYRLKQARVKAGLSQRKLGIAARIDAFVASTRINRYERGIHEPDYKTSQRLSKVLGVPLAFLYAEQDDLAEVIEIYGRMSLKKRREVLAFLTELKPK